MLSVERVLTICSNGSAPLNKMAAMLIYGKKTDNSSSSELALGTQGLLSLFK